MTHLAALGSVTLTPPPNLQTTEAALPTYSDLTLCLGFCSKFSAHFVPLNNPEQLLLSPFHGWGNRNTKVRYPSQSLLVLCQCWVQVH